MADPLIVARRNGQPRSGVVEKKTNSGSIPRVALDPHTMSLLAEHRDRMASRCASIGCSLGDGSYAFSLAPDGSQPYQPRSISQRYRRLAKQLGLRSTRFHALRQYSASEVIAAALREQIAGGRLRPGDQLPTIVEIAATYAVSVGTAFAQRSVFLDALRHRDRQLHRPVVAVPGGPPVVGGLVARLDHPIDQLGAWARAGGVDLITVAAS